MSAVIVLLGMLYWIYTAVFYVNKLIFKYTAKSLFLNQEKRRMK